MISESNLSEQPRYKTVLLFGMPGAGKGTQGQILGQIPGFFHFACGDAFRNLDINSPLGRQFYEYSSRGELVPDELTVQIWREAVYAHTVLGAYKPRVDLLILDGIPRTEKQAQIMDQYVEVLQIIHLVCEDEQAMFERLRRRALKQNRYDDADERVIRKRWEVYEAETKPVLEHYPAERIVNVDSIGSPGKVLSNVLSYVVPVQEYVYRGVLE